MPAQPCILQAHPLTLGLWFSGKAPTTRMRLLIESQYYTNPRLLLDDHKDD